MKQMLTQGPTPVSPTTAYSLRTYTPQNANISQTYILHTIRPRSNLAFCPSSPMLSCLTQLTAETCKMLIREKQTHANPMSNTFHLSMELITVESKWFPIFSSQTQIKLLAKRISTPLLPQCEKSVQNICLILFFHFLIPLRPGRKNGWLEPVSLSSLATAATAATRQPRIPFLKLVEPLQPPPGCGETGSLRRHCRGTHKRDSVPREVNLAVATKITNVLPNDPGT